MSEYMTESEARAVAWVIGSCLMMVRKTEQVGFEPVFESLHRGTPTKVSCYSWNIEHLLTGRALGLNRSERR